MEKLTIKQLQDRANNKLEAKLFYATKKLQEHRMAQDGILDYGVSQETICNMIDSQENTNELICSKCNDILIKAKKVKKK